MKNSKLPGVMFLVLVMVAGATLMGATPAQRPGNTSDCIYFDQVNRDARLCRDAANSLAFRWGTNAQTLSVYETYTSTPDYEKLTIDSAANKMRIYTKDDGSNGTASALQFGVDSTMSWEISTGDDLLAVTDNVYDIGATGATRPRTGYFGTSILAPTGTFATAVTAPTITVATTLISPLVSMNNAAEGGTARFNRLSSHETHTLASASTSDTSTISIPSGAKVHGCSFTVNTAVEDDAGNDTWSAAFITGDTSTLASAAAASQHTKVNTMVVDAITGGVAEVRFTANGGSFSQGVIAVVCYYEVFVGMANGD